MSEAKCADHRLRRPALPFNPLPDWSIYHDMERLLLMLSVLALLSSTTFAATVFQLDVCNKHRTVSEAPGTSLTVTKVSCQAFIAAAPLL